MNTDQDRQEQGHLQHAAEHARPHKKMSVLGYLAILFAVAFLLLLLSYFMQQRSNQDALDDLKQTSVSAVQSLDNLIAERDSLKEQVAGLEDDLAQARADAQQAQEALAQQSGTARQVEAMSWFWQIDDYYARGYYTQAKNLIEAFEAQGLAQALPTENTAPTDRFSPAQRYAEIRAALD